jgi:hypothetical protein
MRTFYKQTIIVLAAIILFGCESNNSVKEIETGAIEVFIINDCEYIAWSGYKCGGIVHKQNCKFCIKRSKTNTTN